MTKVSRLLRFATTFSSVAVWMVVVQVAIAVVLVLDRDTPARFVGYSQATINPDGLLNLRFGVERLRICDLEIVGRYISLKGGSRLYLRDQKLFASDIKELAAESPGVVRESIQLPPGLNVDGGQYAGLARYSCNVSHKIWPIEVPFRVSIAIEPTEGK